MKGPPGEVHFAATVTSLYMSNFFCVEALSLTPATSGGVVRYALSGLWGRAVPAKGPDVSSSVGVLNICCFLDIIFYSPLHTRKSGSKYSGTYTSYLIDLCLTLFSVLFEFSYLLPLLILHSLKHLKIYLFFVFSNFSHIISCYPTFIIFVGIGLFPNSLSTSSYFNIVLIHIFPMFHLRNLKILLP